MKSPKFRWGRPRQAFLGEAISHRAFLGRMGFLRRGIVKKRAGAPLAITGVFTVDLPVGTTLRSKPSEGRLDLWEMVRTAVTLCPIVVNPGNSRLPRAKGGGSLPG